MAVGDSVAQLLAAVRRRLPGIGCDFRPGVGIGTWSVVGGTGVYAKIVGGGRSGHAGTGAQWLARQEGFLTRP